MEEIKRESAAFKHITTGLIFNNRKEACKILGASRYRRALRNREFIFFYECEEGEAPVKTTIK